MFDVRCLACSRKSLPRIKMEDAGDLRREPMRTWNEIQKTPQQNRKAGKLLVDARI